MMAAGRIFHTDFFGKSQHMMLIPKHQDSKRNNDNSNNLNQPGKRLHHTRLLFLFNFFGILR